MLLQTTNGQQADTGEDEDDFELEESSTAYTNPFMPSLVKQKMSMQRRPWAHLYPLRSDGSPIFPNTTVVSASSSGSSHETELSHGVVQESAQAVVQVTDQRAITVNTNTGNVKMSVGAGASRVSPDSTSHANKRPTPDAIKKRQQQLQQTVNNGPAGKSSPAAAKANWELSSPEETMSVVKTGVAWKSLTTPACLPLTTDYFPSHETWMKKFACSSAYSLLLEDIRDQYGFTNYQYNTKITMAQVFNELVGHRLAMGFQIVVPKNTFTYNSSGSNSKSSTTASHSNSNSNNVSVMTNSLTAYFISDISSSFSVIAKRQASLIRGYFKVNDWKIEDFFYILQFESD
jgi:hypothetical protein